MGYISFGSSEEGKDRVLFLTSESGDSFTLRLVGLRIGFHSTGRYTQHPRIYFDNSAYLNFDMGRWGDSSQWYQVISNHDYTKTYDVVQYLGQASTTASNTYYEFISSSEVETHYLTLADKVISKTHESKSYTIRFTTGSGSFLNTYTTTFTVPARQMYAISFDANGGTGGPSGQTKWHNESLSITQSRPTRAGHTFAGWNTAADGSGTSYQPGASYTANSSLTLYAQWTKDAIKPTISFLTVVRCDSSGTQDDQGTYCRVTAAWSVDTTWPDGNAGTVTGTIKPTSGSAVAFSWTSGSTGTGGTAVATISNVDVDTQYTVTVTVTDSHSNANARSDILTRAKFVWDIRAGGLAMGIGSAAPQSGLEVGWVAQFDENVSMLKNLTVSGTITQGSDRRLKEHVAYLGEDAAEFVRRLRPALYRRGGELRLGLYAQDVLRVDEWGTATVTEGAGGLLALDYAAIMAPVVAYCQSLERRIAELEGRR